jgi:hypothetical protein
MNENDRDARETEQIVGEELSFESKWVALPSGARGNIERQAALDKEPQLCAQ